MGSIRANARVVNCLPPAAGERGHAVGVFFLDLASSDRARLDALVARRLAGDAPPAPPAGLGSGDARPTDVKHLRYRTRSILPESR